jgi:hypothetical protein
MNRNNNNNGQHLGNNANGNNPNGNGEWEAVPDEWLVWDMGNNHRVPFVKNAYQIPPRIERVCFVCDKDVSGNFAKVGALSCNHVHCFRCMQKIVDSRLGNRCAVCRRRFRIWTTEAVVIE